MYGYCHLFFSLENGYCHLIINIWKMTNGVPCAIVEVTSAMVSEFRNHQTDLPATKEKAEICRGFSGRPSKIILPWGLRRAR
jgi:hypothetical protein